MFSHASRPARPSSPPITSKSSPRSYSLNWRTRAPPIGQKFDQSFCGQNLEGFAQRSPRYPEHVAELALRHASAVRNVALDNVVPQSRQNFPMQRGLLRTGGGLGSGQQGGRFAGNHGLHRKNIVCGSMQVDSNFELYNVNDMQKLNAIYVQETRVDTVRRNYGQAPGTSLSPNSRPERSARPRTQGHGHARHRSPQL